MGVNQVWNGDRIKRTLLAASESAVNATTASAAARCASYTHVDTGRLRASAGNIPAVRVGNVYRGLFGYVNDPPPYAQPVDLGHHTRSGSWVPGVQAIRRAANETFGEYPAHVRAGL